MKIVRLTESDLTRIIQKVILESGNSNTQLNDELDDKEVIFTEETGLIKRTRQYKIEDLENVKLPNLYNTVKLTLTNGRELTYDCKDAFVDLKEKTVDDETVQKKSGAGWKKYTKWKNPVLKNIIITRAYCGRNSTTTPTEIP